MSWNDNSFEVNVLFISYFKTVCPTMPSATMSSTFVEDQGQLDDPGLTDYFKADSKHHFYSILYDWLIYKLKKQFSMNAGKSAKIIFWYVISSNQNAFNKNGKFHRELAFVVGPQLEDCFYGNPGSTLNVSFTTQVVTGESKLREIVQHFWEHEKRLMVNKSISPEMCAFCLRDTNVPFVLAAGPVVCRCPKRGRSRF